MRLIKLSEFVLQKELNTFTNSIEDVRKYAEFLQNELTLSMFVGDNPIFEDVTFMTFESQKNSRFYKVGDTQVFNISEDGSHIYWHINTIEGLSEQSDNIIVKYS